MQKIVTKIAVLIPTFTLMISVLSASEPASEGKRIEAIKASTDIWTAKVLDATPVGHGTDTVQVSYKIRPSSFLKTSTDGLWVNFLSRQGSQSYGSGYETGLRKRQEWVFFLKKKQEKGKADEWDLLRVEQVGSKDDITNTVERVSNKE